MYQDESQQETSQYDEEEVISQYDDDQPFEDINLDNKLENACNEHCLNDANNLNIPQHDEKEERVDFIPEEAVDQIEELHLDKSLHNEAADKEDTKHPQKEENDIQDKIREESFLDKVEMMSEFNVELKNNNEFINMSRFDESSKVGFPLNNYDYNVTFNRSKVEDNLSPVITNPYMVQPIKVIKENVEYSTENLIKEQLSFSKGNQFSNNNSGFFHNLDDDTVCSMFQRVKSSNTFKKYIQKSNKNIPFTPIAMVKPTKTVNIPKQSRTMVSLEKRDIKLSLETNSTKRSPSPMNKDQGYNKTPKTILAPIKETKPNEDETINRLSKELSFIEHELSTLRAKHHDMFILYNKKTNELEEAKILVEKLKAEVKELEVDTENYKSQLENYKAESNLLMMKKNEKLADLQQKYSELEEEYQEFRLKTNSELLVLKENKQSNESIKLNYYELKNQYELLNMKHQSAQDENFNLKREKLLYEQELKYKSELIDKLRTDLVEMQTKNSNELNRSNLNLNLNLNNIIKSDKCPPADTSDSNTSANNKNSLTSSLNYHYKEKENSTSISKIEANLFKLNQERDKIQSELNKIPDHPKKREQITRRNELEDKLLQYGKDIAKCKQELRELNLINREY